MCINRYAVIPRWPNGYIEPLQAVYCAKPAYESAKNALSEGKLNVQSMVDKLRGVRYVSTLVLQQLDPELRTFFNINTPLDLKKAESMLRTSK
jgi:molybdopterin-guanine dinucleotide biosynthesis protein A